MSSAPVTCGYSACNAEVPAERVGAGSRFCSRRCREKDKHRRSPSFKRKRQRYRAKRARRLGFHRLSPFEQFAVASKPKTRLKVPADAESQARARALIENGHCGYENRDGLICDVAVPRRREVSGWVFAVRKECCGSIRDLESTRRPLAQSAPTPEVGPLP